MGFKPVAISPVNGGFLFIFKTRREALNFYLEGKFRGNLRLTLDGETVFDSMRKEGKVPPRV